MAACLPILILLLVLISIRKTRHGRKADFGFVVVILVVVLLALGARF